MAAAMVGLAICFFCLHKRDEERRLQDLIRTDCLYFERSGMKASEYFEPRNKQEEMEMNGGVAGGVPPINKTADPNEKNKDLNDPKQGVNDNNQDPNGPHTNALDRTMDDNNNDNDNNNNNNNNNPYYKNMNNKNENNPKGVIGKRNEFVEVLKLKDNKDPLEGIDSINEGNYNNNTIANDKPDNTVMYNNYFDKGGNNMNKSIDENPEKMNPELPSEILNKITLPDYNALDPSEIMVNDKRKMGRFFKDELTTYHKVFSIISKVSVLDPVFIRTTKLLFGLTMSFCLNAMLYSDIYITDRTTNQVKPVSI
jgi:hypothetical protein